MPVRPRMPRGPRQRVHPRDSWRVRLALALVVLAGATGCTYATEEPGLFRTREPTDRSSGDQRPPGSANPELPVVGEAVWTTGEGVGVTVRLAVHAVRRIPGATVLDWSVTPIAAPGLAPGDEVPAWVDLGLTSEPAGNLTVFLIDVGAAKVYRPLSHRSAWEYRRCLCSPLWVAERSLRIGETRLLQAAYADLPASAGHVTVTLGTVAPVHHVPVTPVGKIPTATDPTDLARPAEQSSPLAPPRTFTHNDRSNSLSIEVRRITAGPGLTSVEWSLKALTDQPAFGLLPYGPPIAAVLPKGLVAVKPGAASGPRLRVAGRRTLTARWMTVRRQGKDVVECLCTDLGGWAASRREKGVQVSATTNFAGVPPGTRSINVILPGVATLAGLPVVAAQDAALRSGPPERDPSGFWTYEAKSPPRGWSAAEWPTPLPALRQLSDYVGTAEDLLTLPTR